VLDPSGTRIFNLDFSNPIMALMIGIKGRRYDLSDTYNCLIPRAISKIEVVDGSDVYFNEHGRGVSVISLSQWGNAA